MIDLTTTSAVCAGGGDLTYDLNLGQYVCTNTPVHSHWLFWACFLILFAAFIAITTVWYLLHHTVTIPFPGGLVAKLTTTITFVISPAQNPIVVGKSTISGTVGVALNDNIGISGGNGGPYSVASDPSQLPPGVTLNQDGSVVGTPTQAGTFPVGVTIADSDG